MSDHPAETTPEPKPVRSGFSGLQKARERAEKETDQARIDLARALGMDADSSPVESWSTLLGRVSTLEREREAAVRMIASLRSDQQELGAILDVLVTGAEQPLRIGSRRAIETATERLLGLVREKARESDDRVVAVMKFATERILDVLALAAEEGRPADRSLLDVVRAIATGKPGGS